MISAEYYEGPYENLTNEASALLCKAQVQGSNSRVTVCLHIHSPLFVKSPWPIRPRKL
jgi:hypothetical protein